ncbi:hypothetical protein IDJ77_11210 [Mucilaginibacter sp. ZT4R22]|uniref:Uncharacterized protein n=1 Tax=Mucilaginibacter pankratovii TaxID=2772110 RepID=A0ABR7WPZ6_9SPHI|nr:hypothetical protein [Mucilaginibacter pankratovii]MBD1364377.1 hypothetical protein [Mucilaginibacter pankratovii]
MYKPKTLLGGLFGSTELPDVNVKVDLSTKTVVDLTFAFIAAGLVVMIIYHKLFK